MRISDWSSDVCSSDLRGPPESRGVSVAGEPETRWLPKMTYPLVAELADSGIPVTVSCRVLKLARQPYYRWRNDPIRDADVQNGKESCRERACHDGLSPGVAGTFKKQSKTKKKH